MSFEGLFHPKLFYDYKALLSPNYLSQEGGNNTHFCHDMGFVTHLCSFCLLISSKASNPLYRKPISTHNVEFTFNKLNKSYNGTVD